MIVERTPLISCVMVTTGRLSLVQKSVHCFLTQTYPHKELVILSQGEDNADITSFLKTISRPEIMFVEAPPDISLGAMRNTSVELAHGDIICQWDDDDLYHPDRVVTQYKMLRTRSRATASLYTQHLKYFKDQGKMYWVDCADGTKDYVDLLRCEPYKKYLTGSVMFRKWCFHSYNSLLYPEFGHQSDREEDLNVLQKLMHLGEVVPVNKGHYIYVFHGDNTYELHHHQMGLHKKKILDSDELKLQQPYLEDMFASIRVSERFDMCSSPVVDFDEPGTVLGEEVVFTFVP